MLGASGGRKSRMHCWFRGGSIKDDNGINDLVFHDALMFIVPIVDDFDLSTYNLLGEERIQDD